MSLMVELVTRRPLDISAQRRNVLTLPVALDPQTSSITLRIPRPTTVNPIDWPATAKLDISLVVEIDGVEHRCQGSATGGVQRRRGTELAEYSLTWQLPWGFLEGETSKRLGETAKQVFRAWAEIARVRGNCATTFGVEAEIAPAPLETRHHSIALENATAVAEDGGDGTVSTSFTANTASNRVAWVVAGSDRDTVNTTHTVTYGGAGPSYSRPANATDNGAPGFARCTGDVFKDSEIGSGAQTVQLVASGGSGTWGGTTLAILVLSGVDQTTPTGTGGTDGSTAGTGISITVGSVNSTDIVLDGLYIFGAPGAIGANQVERAATNAGSNYTKISSQLGSDGGVMTWGDGSGEFAYVAVAFKEAAGAPSATPKGWFGKALYGPLRRAVA